MNSDGKKVSMSTRISPEDLDFERVSAIRDDFINRFWVTYPNLNTNYPIELSLNDGPDGSQILTIEGRLE
jgi:hypothetical protein